MRSVWDGSYSPEGLRGSARGFNPISADLSKASAGRIYFVPEVQHDSSQASKKKGIAKLRIYFLLFCNSKLSELFGPDGRAQAGRLCYFSLGFRHPGGAERSRAHCKAEWRPACRSQTQ